MIFMRLEDFKDNGLPFIEGRDCIDVLNKVERMIGQRELKYSKIAYIAVHHSGWGELGDDMFVGMKIHPLAIGEVSNLAVYGRKYGLFFIDANNSAGKVEAVSFDALKLYFEHKVND